MNLEDPLARYRAKRDFALTPEPDTPARRHAGALQFVVQKHHASHLHYDFRLEWAGTLKSWAVPKGPSLDPAVKRMAVEVEDHPIAYAGFEGTIPPGQYGAGTVIVWDQGLWQPLGDAAKGLRDGKLEFDLHGHKLAGRWTLVRLRGRDRRPTWLLMKQRDHAARPEGDYVVTEAEPDSVLGRRKPRPEQTPRAPRRTKLPETLQPQLAVRVSEPPATGRWSWELKFDGYRLLARCDGSDVRLFTRNGHDWTPKLRRVADAVRALELDGAWLDGEIVAVDEHGVPSFQRLQNAFEAGTRASNAAIVYHVFDLPFDAGRDLRTLPLAERRAALRGRIVDGDVVRFSEDFDVPPEQMLATACRLRMEGLIGKRLDAPYVGGRSPAWIKLKCSERQEFVIGGYTDPKGSRSGFGSLLLGVHDAAGRLRYAGRVGAGLDSAGLKKLAAKLHALNRDTPPFEHLNAAARAGGPHWVKPELVAEVSFAQWTKDGLVRQAVFHGLRGDKPARAIGVEQAQALAAPEAPAAWPKRLKLTHPERVIDAASGVTKGELAAYYAAAAPRVVAALRGRPVALVRAPEGVDGAKFFQKHARELRIPGIKRLDPKLDAPNDALIQIDTVGALLGAVQFNGVEFHTWNAMSKAIEKPDRIVFDIDPGEGVKWPQIQEAATLVRALLEELELQSLLKTSGGKGLHVVVPLAARWSWDVVRSLAQAAVLHLVETLPDRFVARSGPKNRVGRIFVDYLRNGRGATTAAAWSARARPGLGVSVPLAWDELEAVSAGAHWTVRNAAERLALADPWQQAAVKPQSLSAAMKALDVRSR
jgi:bifunctional non-homologous end joining protein LigD